MTHTSVKPFRQFGFNPDVGSGKSQVVGDCIFCTTVGRKPSFYVNVETQAWDCKRCGESGGLQKFIDTVWRSSKDHFVGDIAKKLSKDRGLKVSTLKDAGIGYHPIIKAYVLPVMNLAGDDLHALKIYKNKKLMMTSGISNILYNGHLLQDGYFNIFLCEGEWDCLAVQEALKQQEKKSDLLDKTCEVAIAVPGAQTFRKEWVGMFSSANVTVLYDNDKAGNEGSGKVYNHLKPICKLLNFYHWREKSKAGMDMRDIYTKVKGDGKKFFSRIKKRLEELPQNVKELDIKVNNNKRPTFNYDGPFISPEEVHKAYGKHLILKFPEVLDVMFSVMIANRHEGDPVWFFIVANSGGTKSELIMSLDSVPNVTSISTLTTNTLISGMETKGGGDPSLIPKLNGRVLTIKDYTTIFGMDRGDQSQISSQLRDAYDGKAAKPYGNGQFRIYESTFGIISGVTPSIETHMEGSTALGERFIRFRVPEPENMFDEMELAGKALDNNAKENPMRQDLADIANRVLSYDYYKDGIPTIPDDIRELLLYLALWVAHMRGTVTRNQIGQITQKANRELSTRLTKQFGKILTSLAMFRGRKEVTMEDFNTLLHIGFSSIPEIRADVLKHMYSNGPLEYYTLSDISKSIRINKASIEKALEDLALLQVVVKRNEQPTAYKIDHKGLQLLDKIGIFKYEPKPKTKSKSKRRVVKATKREATKPRVQSKRKNRVLS